MIGNIFQVLGNTILLTSWVEETFKLVSWFQLG